MYEANISALFSLYEIRPAFLQLLDSQKSICKNLLSSDFNCSHLAAGNTTSLIQAFLCCCLIILPYNDLTPCMGQIRVPVSIFLSCFLQFPVVRPLFVSFFLFLRFPFFLHIDCSVSVGTHLWKLRFFFLLLHFLNLAFTLILEDGFKKTEGKYLNSVKNL